MTTKTVWGVGALVATLATGCVVGDAPIVEEAQGVLGLGTFRWICTGETDPTCGTGRFPSQVALGATFDLQFSLGESLPDEAELSHLDPVSAHRLAHGRDFEALAPGEVGVIAFGPSYTIDYITLHIQPIDGLDLSTDVQADDDDTTTCNFVACSEDPPTPPGIGGPIALAVGVDVPAQVMPLANGTTLAGTLPYTWTSDTPDLLQVSSTGNARAVVLRGLAEGDAQLTVTAGDFTQTFELHVDPPPPEPQRRPPADTDAGTGDSGSDTGDSGSGDSGSDPGDDSGSGESGSGSGDTGTTGGTGR